MTGPSHTKPVRRLTRADAPALRQLWLYALKNSPHSFGLSYVDEKKKSLKQFEEQVAKEQYYGIFAGDRLVAIASIGRNGIRKLSHKAYIYGCYVHPAHRRKGLMKLLITAVLKALFKKHEAALASVVKGNKAALATFASCGFKFYGLEEKAMKTGKRYSDLVLLRRDRA